MPSMLTQNYYSVIGRILFKTFPEVANKLETMIRPGVEINPEKIYYFYSIFDDLELPGYKPVHRRRLFIAAVLMIYYPQFFNIQLVKVKNKFADTIADCFQCHRSHVSRHFKEVVIMYEAYDDFKEKVNEVIKYFNREAN